MSSQKELNSVQAFYKDKKIFITGGSGFMGKVLIEKLLYSCSDVKEVMVLMRSKRGKGAKQRVEDFKKLPCFKRIMEEKPEQMDKITPVWGDTTQINLGLSDVQLQYVIENTQIIFHLAASLKLEATLKPNVLMNLTATKYVLDLAKQMKNLVQMIHTSTAFCNVEQPTLEEKVYESEHKPLDLIKCAEWMTEEAMARTQEEVLGKHVNTYTFTKLLAEILVRDEFKQNNLPVCIVRPSIVTPSFKEPLPGWVDSLNGPSGVIVAAARGVLRCMLLDREANFEAIPVDMAINAMITVVKEHATASIKSSEIPVYNVTVHKSNRITYGDLFDVVESVRFDLPLSFGLWYPTVTITTNKYYFMAFTFLFQWLPAYFIDFLLMIFGQKRFMIRVQQKIAVGMDVLKCFTLNTWWFKSDNYHNLIKRQSKDEYDMFFIDTLAVDTKKCMKTSCEGGRVYLARDPLSTLPRAKIVVRIQYLVDRVVKMLILYWLIKKLLTITGLMDPLMEMMHNSVYGFGNVTSS